MTIGFKTGPRNWEGGKIIVEEEGARMCEIWFRVDKKDDYREMMDWLKKHEVQAGLHYWGLAQGDIKPNLMTKDKQVRQETIEQMRQTIEIGAAINGAYVNVHPGARALEKMDFAKGEQVLIENSFTEEAEAERLLLEALGELNSYAKENGVLLTVETLPGRESRHIEKRQGIYDPGNPPLELMRRVAEAGFWLANDLTHSASSLGLKIGERENLFEELLKFTKDIADQTKLVHVNTVAPPLDNGTDSHDGILADDFAKNVFPDKAQLKQLLQVFRNREDVFLVPEPKSKMGENYLALREVAT